MTAIFGILGAAHPGEIEAMAHRMAHRGAVFEIWQPAEGVHLGICHRVHVMKSPTATGLTVALDGVIENGRELGAPAATDPAVSDRRLVAELYRRHGLDALAKLRGGFAVAIWDEAARRAGAGGRLLRHALAAARQGGGAMDLRQRAEGAAGGGGRRQRASIR